MYFEFNCFSCDARSGEFYLHKVKEEVAAIQYMRANGWVYSTGKLFCCDACFRNWVNKHRWNKRGLYALNPLEVRPDPEPGDIISIDQSKVSS